MSPLLSTELYLSGDSQKHQLLFSIHFPLKKKKEKKKTFRKAKKESHFSTTIFKTKQNRFLL